jgi:hypothetical protein
VSGEALRDALAARGIVCTVEARGRLAVVVATLNTVDWAAPERAADVVALAVAAGFTHVALELPAEGAGAPLSGA